MLFQKTLGYKTRVGSRDKSIERRCDISQRLVLNTVQVPHIVLWLPVEDFLSQLESVVIVLADDSLFGALEVGLDG